MPISVSAIVPVYNTDHRLSDAIDSVLSQTCPVHELIVVDDGSSHPATLRILESYRDRITLIRQLNSGASAARNNAAYVATGNWLAFLDSDDQWLPDKLERQVAEIDRNAEVALCYGSMIWIDINGNHTVRRVKRPHELFPAIRLGNQFPPTVTMIRKDVFLSAGGFKVGLTGCEDWELFIRIAHSYTACCVLDPVAVYNESWSSISLKPDIMLPATRSIIDSLLVGIASPLSRWLWRRRIEASIWRQAAIGFRRLGQSGLPYLFRSLLCDPSLDSRYRTIALELGSILGRRPNRTAL
jgi:glycosyltransferase involved in cell wall biosynthesis